MMKEENHVFQGLRRDNHQIRQDGKFLWDAHNIRLTNRDDSTLLSITNERGTLDTGVSLNGEYVGHCIVGRYLVVFTSEGYDGNSYIYRIEKTGDVYKTIILFSASEWDESWSVEHPIQTIGLYETELIQKVYWIDDIHQPRMINVAKPELKIPDELHDTILVNGVNLSVPEANEDMIIRGFITLNFPNGVYPKDSFDFVRKLSLDETVEVEKSYSYGEFSPGTIQYALSYYDKYGQESNIFYTTPLYYISHKDRAGDGEDKCSNNFTITVHNPDKFDFIRVYSIHRTSIDAVPTVKIVGDMTVANAIMGSGGIMSVSLIDTGTEGITVDASQLLYLGGDGIIAKTIVQKDNTIFLGNISYPNNVSKKVEGILKSKITKGSMTVSGLHGNSRITSNSYYDYNPSLDGYNAKFKIGETYRCGIQAQLENGKWTDPIYYDDIVLSDSYDGLFRDIYKQTVLNITLTQSEYAGLWNLGVRKLRPCVVFPRTGERDIICQGLLNPTMYSTKDRDDLNLFNISSWFFRPIKPERNPPLEGSVRRGANIVFEHKEELPSSSNQSAEIQGYGASEGSDEERIKVDENTVTFHSPDIEFDTTVQNTSFENTYLRIVGCVPIKAIAGKINLQTKSPAYGDDDGMYGVNEVNVGFNISQNPVNGGLITGLFYRDKLVRKDFDSSKGNNVLFPVYPWHRSGSLNNDSKRPVDKGERTAVLSKKVISNLKFFGDNIAVKHPRDYSIITPQLFNSNELSIIKYRPSYMSEDVQYMGNVDRVYKRNKYPLYNASTSDITTYQEITGEDNITESSDPVRIKYKSTPHLMMSMIDASDSSRLPLLPRFISEAASETTETIEDTPDGTVGRDKSSLYDLSDVYEKPLGCVGVKFDRAPQYITDYNLSSIHYYDDLLCDAEKVSGNPRLTPHSFPENTVIIKVPVAPSNYPASTQIPDTVQFTKKLPIFKGGALKISEFKISKYGTNWREYTGTTTKYLKFYLEDNGSTKNCKVTKVEDVTAFMNTKPGTRVDGKYTLVRDNIQCDNINILDGYYASFNHYMILADLCRNNVVNKFGGKTEEALQSNQWYPAGAPINLSTSMEIPVEYGDTWYARYDCLKTYPFTEEDENQIVEIGSFMCETRYNIDGRYDRNRGQYDNTAMRPTNFNLINEVYSQKDNYFNYRRFDTDYYKQGSFVNQIMYSLGKNAGEEIDTWAKITSATPIDMDGDNGEITSLNAWNENLLCFQERALSQIMFNSRVQVQASDGVPIEIANSSKVDGTRLLSSHVGCKDKWSTLSATSGLYFLDSNTDSLYAFNGQLVNIGEANGMDWWAKDVHTGNTWKSVSYPETEPNGVRMFYDGKYGDIYYTPGLSNDQKDSLCYSEQLGQFTSLMSYGGTQAMFNFDDEFYSLRSSKGNTKLYLNNKGQYNDFFGDRKGWSFSFISNDNPTITKVFDTIEIRTDHYDTFEAYKLLNSCPLNYVEVDNEYQHSGTVTLDNKNMRKKFRVWRGLLPRNEGTMQRIRNTWSMITLGWKPIRSDCPGSNSNKAVIHDVSVKYTI